MAKNQRLCKNFYSTFFSLLIILVAFNTSAQPEEKGNFRESDLVELIELDSTLKLDIRYATANNFIGKAVYTEARAFLQRPAAEALIEVSQEFKKLGYGLVIFDGYRPWSVTKAFWDLTAEKERAFVADPKDGSRHNRGCAVDLSLYKIDSGENIEMPSGYDEMNETAHPDYQGGTAEQREMRDLLRSKMEEHGFSVYENEWWHFDYKDWEKYRIQNIPFSAIE